MGEQFHFEQFPAYIAAEQFILSIQPLLNSKDIHRSTRDQLYRASLSIALNIAEGSGKYVKKEKRHYYTITRGSVHECVSILRILKLQDHLSPTDYDSLYRHLTTVSKMLSGLIKAMSESQ